MDPSSRTRAWLTSVLILRGLCFYLKFWVKLTTLEQNRQLSIYFRYSTSAVTPTDIKKS